MTDTNASLTKNYLTVGKIEGYSYLALLFIAMPLKYLADIPTAVRIAGSIHGVLFVAFVVFIILMLVKKATNRRKCHLCIYAFTRTIRHFLPEKGIIIPHFTSFCQLFPVGTLLVY
jgi:integral membrane protein